MRHQPEDETAVDPIVDINDDGYYVGAWFLAGHRKDFLAVLHRDPVGTLQLDYRFRYYAPEDGRRDPFDGRDEKSIYSATVPDKTEDEAILDELVDGLVRENFCGTRLPWKVRKRRHRVIVRGSGKTFKQAVLSLPFVHVKIVDQVPRGARN